MFTDVEVEREDFPAEGAEPAATISPPPAQGPKLPPQPVIDAANVQAAPLKADVVVVDPEDPKAPAPAPAPEHKAKGPPESLRNQWQEFQHQQQAAQEAAAQGAVAASAEEPPFSVPETYQGFIGERRHIICRPQGLVPLEEFCVCIDFHNVLDLGNGGRFLSVDQRIVSALRELLVDCAPVRLHICNFTGRGQAEHYWSTNIEPCLEQLREALSSPSIRVTAQHSASKHEDGKVHRLSLLTPNRPHVFIDDNLAICKEARRTNALVVEVNKRLGVVGLVEELRVLRGTIGFYNRDRLYPAFVLPPHRYLPNS